MPATYTRPAVSGSGAIACGLAAAISTRTEVILLARSSESGERAQASVDKHCGKLEGGDPDRIKVVTDPEELAEADLIVEAIVESAAEKSTHLAELGAIAGSADLATTTSSLSIVDLAERIGEPERFYGLHVFNPVTRMELVELCLPESLADGVADRARGFCEALGKTAIEVPDQAGFVVNRLLFPFLFDAVRLQASSGMDPADVDACMSLGAGHPMGPLALLDFIGLDVAKAIGDSVADDTGQERDRAPDAIDALIAAGRLGRKSGAGFYDYS